MGCGASRQQAASVCAFTVSPEPQSTAAINAPIVAADEVKTDASKQKQPSKQKSISQGNISVEESHSLRSPNCKGEENASCRDEIAASEGRLVDVKTRAIYAPDSAQAPSISLDNKGVSSSSPFAGDKVLGSSLIVHKDASSPDMCDPTFFEIPLDDAIKTSARRPLSATVAAAAAAAAAAARVEEAARYAGEYEGLEFNEKNTSPIVSRHSYSRGRKLQPISFSNDEIRSKLKEAEAVWEASALRECNLDPLELRKILNERESRAAKNKERELRDKQVKLALHEQHLREVQERKIRIQSAASGSRQSIQL